MNNILRRTLTGAWIVIIVMGGFVLHPLSFVITGLALLTGVQYEYLTLIRNNGVKPQMVSGLITGAAVYVISTLIAYGLTEVNTYLLLIPLLLVITIAELYRKEKKPFDSLAHTLFSVIYAAVPFSMFPFMAFSREGMSTLIPYEEISFSPGIIVGFFVLIWVYDSGAYLTGITLGKHRLMERISPKKSWEGFAGGMILTVIVARLLSGWLGVINNIQWIIVSLIVVITGTYGDLVESMLKRSIGIKDSGTIMPGHGGFLDRFDSVLLSFPPVYLFVILFG